MKLEGLRRGSGSSASAEAALELFALSCFLEAFDFFLGSSLGSSLGSFSGSSSALDLDFDFDFDFCFCFSRVRECSSAYLFLLLHLLLLLLLPGSKQLLDFFLWLIDQFSQTAQIFFSSFLWSFKELRGRNIFFSTYFRMLRNTGVLQFIARAHPYAFTSRLSK